jgi:hypothetical protein
VQGSLIEIISHGSTCEHCNKSSLFWTIGEKELSEEKVPILVYLKRNAILLLPSTINCHLCVCVCVCVCVHTHMLSRVRLFATPWTVAASLVKIIREWSLWLCLIMSYVSCINLSVFRELSEMVHIYSLMTSMTPKPSSSLFLR